MQLMQNLKASMSLAILEKLLKKLMVRYKVVEKVASTNVSKYSTISLDPGSGSASCLQSTDSTRS